jgi:hypothetical protein
VATSCPPHDSPQLQGVTHESRIGAPLILLAQVGRYHWTEKEDFMPLTATLPQELPPDPFPGDPFPGEPAPPPEPSPLIVPPDDDPIPGPVRPPVIDPPRTEPEPV